MSENLIIDDILSGFNQTKPLSKGGQKVVFTVAHPIYGVCVLKIGKYSSRATLERVQREVSILGEIDSKYFPKQFVFEIVDQERYFILEELLKGDTLDKRFKQFSNEKSVARLGVELLAALQLLWDKKVVHRDLKPSNIIITDDGPRIIDLGIARLLDATSITDTYAPYGPCTPNYASPEQLENRKRDIDYRSDQFSLGIILAQLLLNGAHPFAPEVVGAGDSIPMNILTDLWAKDLLNTHVTTMFSTIKRMLGHDPYQRYRNAGDLLAHMVELAKE